MYCSLLRVFSERWWFKLVSYFILIISKLKINVLIERKTFRVAELLWKTLMIRFCFIHKSYCISKFDRALDLPLSLHRLATCAATVDKCYQRRNKILDPHETSHHQTFKKILIWLVRPLQTSYIHVRIWSVLAHCDYDRKICNLTICHRSHQICSIVGMILKFSFYIELYILQSVNFTNTTFATKV